ncbi:MAG TPA: hypothetical protein VJ826_06850, partial [Candidatus Polarisedimenticolaceae bacterium]|nr:hypothetical protein [Candidatus Polarisedimenticolaceae bacterium]
MRFAKSIAACTLFLASAGASAQVQLDGKGEARRPQQEIDCANLPPSAGPRPLDVVQRCAGY